MPGIFLTAKMKNKNYNSRTTIPNYFLYTKKSIKNKNNLFNNNLDFENHEQENLPPFYALFFYSFTGTDRG